MTNIFFDRLFFVMFMIVPALLTMIMMLEGRFSGMRRWFLGAFVLQCGLGGILVMIYFILPRPVMFDDSFGFLGLPGFQVYSASTLSGALLGGLIIAYEDMRALWSPDDDPRGREEIPEDLPKDTPSSGNTVVSMPRRNAS